jgi:hypothetical protein
LSDAQDWNPPSKGSRPLLAATLAYALAASFALVVIGTMPAASDTGSELTAWVRANREAIRWGVWAFTVATPPFAIIAASLRRLLPPLYRDVFLIGAIAYIAEIAVWSWTWGGLALHPDSTESATARTVFDVACFLGPVLTSTTTTMFAPVTLLALRGQYGFPLWLGILGAIALAEQTIETITIFGSTGFTQPGGAMNMQLGAGLTLLWILAVGVWGGVRGRFENAVP